jgi:phage tail tape-measure protein
MESSTLDRLALDLNSISERKTVMRKTLGTIAIAFVIALGANTFSIESSRPTSQTRHQIGGVVGYLATGTLDGAVQGAEVGGAIGGVAGGIAGAIMGAPEGGVGAIPGAAAGAVLGGVFGGL